MSWRYIGVGLTTLTRGGGSSLVTVMASNASKAVIATLLTASAERNANGSCCTATSPNLRRYCRDKSFRCWRIVEFTSAQRAASTGCSILMGRLTGSVGHGHHRSQGQCHDSGHQDRTKCGAKTQPTCILPCMALNCTSFWRLTFGAARWSPGMSPNTRIKLSQPIW